MKRISSFAVLCTAALLPTAAVCGAEPLPRSAPEAQGVSSVALRQLVETFDREIEGMHSLTIVRRGHVIAEGWWAPYAPEHRQVLYSLSKSFTSTAVGFCVAEGRLSIDDPVLKFFPDEAPADPSPELRAMRIRDLLTMTAGHADEAPMAPETMSANSFLAHPVPHPPGTHFRYNTPATFMQSAIVRKATGETVLDYLRPRLFEPLGIENPAWDTNFEGTSLGGYGLRVRTEDIAKFGQLYLQKGLWAGRRILPAEWVESATSRQVPNGTNPESDWNQGYGFQFWRCRHNAYRGDGAFGQYCVVVPDRDVVVAITAGLGDMQAVLTLLWDRLLPACADGSLGADETAHSALKNTLARLAIAPAPGEPRSATGDRVSNRAVAFPENAQGLEALRIVDGGNDDGMVLEMRFEGRTVRFPCGYRVWKSGRAPVPAGPLARFPDEPVAGTYGWEGDLLRVKVCAYETPFHLQYTLRFEENRVTLDAETNVAFGPTRRPQIVGRME